MKTKILLLTLMFCFVSCSTSTRIKDIEDHPRQYVDREVYIEGKVNSVFSLGWIHYFEVDDGSGVIKVVTSKPLPREGEILEIKGIVNYYTIATLSTLVIKESE